jgi:hypothetical protein
MVIFEISLVRHCSVWLYSDEVMCSVLSFQWNIFLNGYVFTFSVFNGLYLNGYVYAFLVFSIEP